MGHDSWITGIYNTYDGIFSKLEQDDEIYWLQDIIEKKLGKEHLWDEDGEYRFKPKDEYDGYRREFTSEARLEKVRKKSQEKHGQNPEIDYLVAEHIMNRRASYYTTDISAAMDVVNKLIPEHIIQFSWCDGWEVGHYDPKKNENFHLAEDKSLPKAICKAALRLKGIEV